MDMGRVRVRDVNNGVYLTWKELSVTVSNGSYGSSSILQGITGFASQGQVLALMGPSGSGKTTLLDALAGRLDSNTKQGGEVLINGGNQTLSYGTLAYVTQDDVLTSTLTVQEAMYYSAQLQLPTSVTTTEKKERADTAIKEMGLQDAVNTRIGGWCKKGLSNGQKRRVSICMEILRRPKLLFLDEPTSGLDSAASHYVMRRIVSLAQQDNMTIIASIHQPSSEVFQFFHNLCLLSLGKMVYFGPSHSATEFFALNGFPCPTPQNPSDHFLRTINTDFNRDDEEQGLCGDITTEEVINILQKSYKSSNICQQTYQKIDEICIQCKASVEKRNHACFTMQCMVLTRRSLVNMYRDLGYYWLRLVIYIALALGLGSVFYNIGSDYGSIHARGSILMFVASFLTIMAIGGFPSFVEDLKVLRRERLNGHYSAGAFVIGNTLSSIPYLVIISLIPGAITYYLVGLHRGYEHFIFYTLTLFTCMLLVESLMMIVASLMPSFLMGLITGAGIQGLMMLSGGYFRLPNDLPLVLWKYPLYYVAFHKYAFQGLYKNEFEGRVFSNIDGKHSYNPRDSYVYGEEILKNVWQMEICYSKWVDLGILFVMVIVYRILFFVVLKVSGKCKFTTRIGL